MDNADAMLEIMEACYKVGGRGIEAVPAGAACDAIKTMKETHSDYVVTGSTLPGPDPNIEALIDVDAKIIFVHGIVSEKMDDRLNRLVDEIASRGVNPGIALHNAVPTLEYALENLPQVKAFLVPFNANGLYMGDKEALEKIVDNNKDKWFVGMKTLAAGKLEPLEAYDYISKHNICAVTIGMVTVEEAETSTKIALQALQK